MKFLKYIYILIFIFIITSCMEEDIPVKPYPRGDEKTATIEMTSKYSNQIYFHFETGEVVKQNQYDIWDLAFMSYGNDSYYVLLNGAKFMEAADFGNVSFESITSSKDAKFRYDSTNADYDNYSIGKWWKKQDGKILSNDHVYIINRGNNIQGKKLGYIKMMFLGIENNQYKIKFSNLDGSNESIALIPRDEKYNFIYFSFNDGGKILELEPESTKWDLLFTKYIAFLPFEGNLLPYSVTGVLINNRYVSVASDTTMNFKDITLDSIKRFTFSNRPDYIGHEWKKFTLTGESYAVRPEINYFLNDYQGFYWKFHFTFFYNEKGERGYPKFDFKKL